MRTPATPVPRPGAAAELGPQPGAEADQRACGLPGALLPDWPQRLLEAFRQALDRNRALRHAMTACVGCGACAPACPFYLGTADPLNIPGLRAGLLREVYRRHLAPGRRPRPELLDPDLPEQWLTYLHQCSLCRRCAVFCPLGIDTGEVALAGREILAEMGLTARETAGAAASCLRHGNQHGIAPASWAIRAASMEQELKRETGQDILCPVDERRAEVLLIPASRDLTEHRGTFKGYAKVFHAAGVSWTTSTHVNEAGNPGGYLDYRNLRRVHRRVLEAARELKPKAVVWGETGQGWRVARVQGGSLDGGWGDEPYLELAQPVHILAWTLHLHLRGAFQGQLDRGANEGLKPTYHDPCHLARSAELTREPRALLLACAPRMVEMPARAARAQTLCCGAGGGLEGVDRREAAMAGGLPLARELAGLAREQGVNWVATACATCKGALKEAMRRHGLGLGVGGVMELMGRALHPPAPPPSRESGS